MSVQLHYVVSQKASALSAGIAIVRQILKDHHFPDGVTTKRLYELSQLESYPPPPRFLPMKNPGPNTTTAPRPDHPIRSITFLKTMILPALEGQQEIKTVIQPVSGVHAPPDLSNLRPIKRAQRAALAREFVWKVVPPEERKIVPTVAEGENDNAYVSGDITHLNKRRQRARVMRVTEEVNKLRGGLPFSKELKQVASIPPMLYKN